jgi:hypothetical protein
VKRLEWFIRENGLEVPQDIATPFDTPQPYPAAFTPASLSPASPPQVIPPESNFTRQATIAERSLTFSLAGSGQVSQDLSQDANVRLDDLDPLVVGMEFVLTSVVSYLDP